MVEGYRKEGEPFGITKFDPENPDETRFGRGYVPTKDEQLLIERADAAHNYLDDRRLRHRQTAVLDEEAVEEAIRESLEILEAVVWPTDEILEAQRTRVRG